MIPEDICLSTHSPGSIFSSNFEIALELRSCPCHSANTGHLREGAVSHGASQTDISNLGCQILAQQDIGGLEVHVDNFTGVEVNKPSCHIQCNLSSPVRIGTNLVRPFISVTRELLW